MQDGDQLNAIRSGVAGPDEYRVLNMPRVSVYFTGNTIVGLTNGVGAIVTWDVADYDTDSMWSGNVLKANTPGLYQVNAWVLIPNLPATLREMYIVKVDASGSHIYAAQSNPGNGGPYNTNLATGAQIVLLAGDYVYVVVIQVSGANTNLGGVALPDRLNGFQACMISTL